MPGLAVKSSRYALYVAGAFIGTLVSMVIPVGGARKDRHPAPHRVDDCLCFDHQNLEAQHLILTSEDYVQPFIAALACNLFWNVRSVCTALACRHGRLKIPQIEGGAIQQRSRWAAFEI